MCRKLKIISGGQTGVDKLALEIAKEISISTGGTAPKGYLTENGSDFSLKSFGLVEHKSSKYPPRTLCNVKNSHGTIYFASDTKSRGLKLTKKLCIENEKPFLLNPKANELTRWLDENNISILNIAGNRASKMTLEYGYEIKEILLESFSSFL